LPNNGGKTEGYKFGAMLVFGDAVLSWGRLEQAFEQNKKVFVKIDSQKIKSKSTWRK
jgi:hypothetical protein